MEGTLGTAAQPQFTRLQSLEGEIEIPAPGNTPAVSHLY
jgi:hypothetical protein